MTPVPDLTTATWRKSSYSNGDGGACVEVADDLPGVVPVRDSKIPSGDVLLFLHSGWSTFVDAVRTGSISGT
ncbi:DUF397 domain-containing protein [Streptomyces sp. NPDC054841]